ncbi:MAG: glycosyl hydrolase, partial [Niastella sp.]
MKQLLFSICLLFVLKGRAQTAWFIDGYHGGIYGHLPPWQTKFMVEKLAQYPDWKINLELEPESWDSMAVQDAANYATFQKLFTDQSAN